MKTYAPNSPQAAARIVALAMIADGQLKLVEREALNRLDISSSLGISRQEWTTVVGDLCADLLASAAGNGVLCKVTPEDLAQVLSAIDDPGLRIPVMQLCMAVADADRSLAPGEAVVLRAMVEHWGMGCRRKAPPRVAAAA